MAVDRRLLDAVADRLVVTPRCARLFRCWVAGVVLLDCVDRWDVLEWMYTDTGALPRAAVLPAPHEDRLLWMLCAHAWHGSLAWVRALVVLEACAAIAFGFGVRWCGALTWWLHLSICVRSAPLIYILDRYLNLLLLYATLLPTPPAGGEWSLASLGIGLQLLAIYADAGLAKWSDPAGAWSLSAPVAALDTYMRHTPAARLAHALLGGDGLRIAGAGAVAVELFAAPLALCAAPSVRWRRLAAAAGISLHLGIALTMRNTVILSLAAIGMWLPFLDGPRRARVGSNTEGEGCGQPCAMPEQPLSGTATDSAVVATPVAAKPAPPLAVAAISVAGRSSVPTAESLLPDVPKKDFRTADEWAPLAPDELAVARRVRDWLGAERFGSVPHDLLVTFIRGYAYRTDWAECTYVFLERALAWRAERQLDRIITRSMPNRHTFETVCPSGPVGFDDEGHMVSGSGQGVSLGFCPHPMCLNMLHCGCSTTRAIRCPSSSPHPIPRLQARLCLCFEISRPIVVFTCPLRSLGPAPFRRRFLPPNPRTICEHPELPRGPRSSQPSSPTPSPNPPIARVGGIAEFWPLESQPI
jgi:hypothetical protein